jgi:hypothetical protein
MSSAKDSQKEDIDEVMESRFKADGSWARPPRQMDAEVYGKEIRRYIEGCLGELPTGQRTAFVLREVESLETDEICKVLGVTVTDLGVLRHGSPGWSAPSQAVSRGEVQRTTGAEGRVTAGVKAEKKGQSDEIDGEPTGLD